MHFTPQSLLNPTNRLTMTVIGAGGTGSQVVTALARLHTTLTRLNHPGLQVTLWDGDQVSPANLGRQLFAEAEVGFPKCVVLINRMNRFFGTNWKAMPYPFTENVSIRDTTNFYVSCVDSVASRTVLANYLKKCQQHQHSIFRERPYYWIDYGNGQKSGQVLLATVGSLPQPNSNQFETIPSLPFITDEYAQPLREAETATDIPSCSVDEALLKQDLFINSTLANLGSSLLWDLFRKGMTDCRGIFLNLGTYRTLPIAI